MTVSNTELHWRVYKNETKISLPKSEWSYNIRVYGNVFCLDKTIKSIRSPSFKVRIVAEKKWNKIAEFLYIWCWGQGFEGVQSIGTRVGLVPYITITCWTIKAPPKNCDFTYIKFCDISAQKYYTTIGSLQISTRSAILNLWREVNRKSTCDSCFMCAPCSTCKERMS